MKFALANHLKTLWSLLSFQPSFMSLRIGLWGKKKNLQCFSLQGLQLLGLWSETAGGCAQAKLLPDYYQFAWGRLAGSKTTGPARSKLVPYVPIYSWYNLNSCAYLTKVIQFTKWPLWGASNRTKIVHSWSNLKEQEFPGDPVVKTLPSKARGMDFIPGEGTKIQQASGCGQNLKKKKRKKTKRESRRRQQM